MLSVYLMQMENPSDKAKFEQIYRENRQRMYYAALQILQEPSEAEDCVHEAFLSMIEHWDQVGFPRDPRTKAFAIIITRNKAYDYLRRQGRTIPLEFLQTATAPDPFPDGTLEAAMSRLPASQKDLLLMKYYIGYSVKEISELLGVNYHTVKKHLHLARKALKIAMEEEGGL